MPMFLLLAGLCAASAAAAPVSAFPSVAARFADAVDPLRTLATGEELRDALASPPSDERLQAGLRDPRVPARLDAIADAARPRGVRAVPYLAGAMLRLDEPVSVRSAAALALGRVGDEIAVPALAEALADPAPEVRYAAALALGRVPVDGVATRLERALARDPDWRPRFAAAIALGRCRRTFVRPDLLAALSGDPAWQVRQQAARSLSDLGDPLAVDALIKALRDPEPSVRAAAGDALAAFPLPAARAALAQALRSETEPAVRAVLAARRARS